MSGFKPSDLFMLPADERRVLTWLLRRGEGSFEELLEYLNLSATSVSLLLERLMRRGVLDESSECGDKRYRVRLGSTKS